MESDSVEFFTHACKYLHEIICEITNKGSIQLGQNHENGGSKILVTQTQNRSHDNWLFITSSFSSRLELLFTLVFQFFRQELFMPCKKPTQLPKQRITTNEKASKERIPRALFTMRLHKNPSQATRISPSQLSYSLSLLVVSIYNHPELVGPPSWAVPPLESLIEGPCSLLIKPINNLPC